MKVRYISIDLQPDTQNAKAPGKRLAVVVVLAAAVGLIHYVTTGDPSSLKDLSDALRHAAVVLLGGY